MRSAALGALIVGACAVDPSSSSAPDAAGVDAGAPLDASGADASAPPGPRYTYFRDAKPLIDARCASCHRSGGAGPLPLTSYAEVFAARVPARLAIEDGRMPPWHAAEGCGSFSNDRSLSAEERALLLEWLSDGAPEGEAASEGAPLPPADPGLTRIDLRLPVEGAYAPRSGDDYRCFVLEWPEAEPRYITGYDLAPSNAALVHHANLYAIAPAQAAMFRQRQAQDRQPGYSCFGGVFTSGTALVGSWAPGSFGLELPRGAGMLVEPGSVIVAELHFNTDRGVGEDRSEIRFKLEREVERRALIIPFWDFFRWSSEPGGMPIPRGERDVVHSVEYDPNPYRNVAAPWIAEDEILIHGLGMHMHQLGKSGRLEIRRPGAAPQCALEIPRWDFAWQTSYMLAEPQAFTLGVDRLFAECRFDNGEENQPIVDGVRQPSRDVSWGQGSRDEMCIGYVLVTER